MSNLSTKTEKLSAVAGVYKNGFFKPAVQLPEIKTPRRAVLVFLEDVYEGEEELIPSPPPTRDKKTIIKEFRKTGKYSEQFLKDLENGLSRSSYFK